MILASVLKNASMKTILALVWLSNVVVGVSYLLDGSGINGAASLFLASVQTLINYTFERKNKPLPLWLLCIYAVSIITLNFVVSGLTPLCVLVIVASLSFLMCIGQKNAAGYRFWTLVNMVLWCLYDILSRSFGALTTHVTLLIFTVAGMLLYDTKRTSKNSKE
jgi:hypothetical protein